MKSKCVRLTVIGFCFVLLVCFARSSVALGQGGSFPPFSKSSAGSKPPNKNVVSELRTP
jgi:hypothetical protein